MQIAHSPLLSRLLSNIPKLLFRSWPFFAGAILLATHSLAAAADVGGNNTPDGVANLKKLSLDELLQQQVSLVSRTPENITRSPSAVQVITGEDIDRSSANTLPEALRLASNLEVSRVNGNSWAISARGFNQPSGLSDKLLVMLDGRTVYTPLYGGVFWDVQNVMLEDVDRVEVVSGPGATLWGANAVNGVINVVSKSARETQGTYLSAGGGSFMQDLGAFRYGDSVGTNFFFRLYGERFDTRGTLSPNGSEGPDSREMSQGGFRTDWYPNQTDNLTIQGDVYSGVEQATGPDTGVDGQNLLGRWTHTLAQDSEIVMQAYFDRTWRKFPGTFTEDLKTYDIDIQHRFPIGARQKVLWGAGYRLMDDAVGNFNGGPLAFYPAERELQLFSLFGQHELTWIEDRLKSTIGARLEHNDFSGFEIQPSARLAWTPDARQTIWAGISRAVRSPSRIDQDYHIPANAPYFVNGGPNFQAEKVTAYELGYRVEPVKRLSLSAASFYNRYHDIRSVELVNPVTGTYEIENGLKGNSWGGEFSFEYQPLDGWRLKGGYTFLKEQISQRPGHIDLSAAQGESNDPRNQITLQSMINLTKDVHFDVIARYVGALDTPHVPAYAAVDLHIAWEVTKHLELSLVGENLNGSHAEFGPAAVRQEIPRSIFGKMTWRF